ncbi:MAG: polysaccharide biosynthesis tyrosine autokinase [Solirubrobacterales bacterium]
MRPETGDDATGDERDLERALAVARRRWPLVLLCLVVTAAAALAYSLLQQKEYSSTASLLFRQQQFAQDLFGSSTTPANASPVREAATNEKLASLKVIASRTSKALGGSPSAATINGQTTVSSAGESEIVTIRVTNSDAVEAAHIANTFARQFIQFRREADKRTLTHARSLAEDEYERLSPDEQRSARGEALSRAAEKLGVLASLQTGDAELVEIAEPASSPSVPRTKRNVLLGAVVGLLIGLVVAFIFERLNRKIRTPEEAREAFGLPILGTIPESKAIDEVNHYGTSDTLPLFEGEAFRTLHASLRYFNVDKDIRTVLITSFGAEMGKSTVSWNLAMAAAGGSKAVVLETDLRKPGMVAQHSLRPGPGLSEVLTRQADLDEVIRSKAVPGTSNGSGAPERALSVIPAGATPPNPADLLESKMMSDVLDQLVNSYDLVVIDTSPVGIVADAFPLLKQVDGVVVVARMDMMSYDLATKLREQLQRLDAPLLGVVANGIKIRKRDKYGYGYTYYAAREQGSDKSSDSKARSAAL